MTAVALSGDGRWLASGRWDATVRVWDRPAADPAASARVLRGQADVVTGVALSKDGPWLASSNGDPTVRVWDRDLDTLIAEACRTAGRNLWPAEWARYMGGEAYRKTCPAFPSGETLAPPPATPTTLPAP